MKDNYNIKVAEVTLTKAQLNIVIKLLNAINDNLDISETVDDLSFIDKCECLFIERKLEEKRKELNNGS